MNTNTIIQIENFVGYYLDKLKVKSPIFFVLVKTLLMSMLVMFSDNIININDTIDTYAILLLTAIVGYSSARTTQYKQNYEEGKANFPDIDQSNN